MDKKGVILVVDDEKDVTMSLQGFFTALGHDMLTALDGNEAIKVIDSVSLDLVLLDVRMPGVDGIQVLKHIRKNKPRAKVIIITAYDKDVKEEVERLGIDGFFAKPIDLSNLLERIRYVIETPKDTRAYPTKEKQEGRDTLKETPKAKLLFVEPNPMVYGFTCGFFSGKDLIKGEYESKVVFGGKEALTTLYEYQPDIVIMYDSLMNVDDVKDLAGFLMRSSHKPKTVILHGLIPKSQFEIIELEKAGIKFCNQNSMDDDGFRVSNKKLADFVGKECVKHGLIKK